MTKAAGTAAGVLLAIATLTACSAPSPQPSNSPSSSASASGDSSSASASGSPSSSASASSDAVSTVGNLVSGFPATLLPLMDGAQIKQSAFDKSKDPAVASLVASSTASNDDIVAFYTKAFTDQGFTLVPTDPVGGLVIKDFFRNDGKEQITLSISSENGSNTFTLGANVAPASLK